MNLYEFAIVVKAKTEKEARSILPENDNYYDYDLIDVSECKGELAHLPPEE